MRFRSYDALALFDVVARHLSFTAAAEELNLTKGAVSYQIKRGWRRSSASRCSSAGTGASR